MLLSHSDSLNRLGSQARRHSCGSLHLATQANNFFNEQTLFPDQLSTAKNSHGDLTTAVLPIMTRSLTLNEELLYRQLHGNRGVGAINKLYGAQRWVKDLDIIGELRGHDGCINALQ